MKVVSSSVRSFIDTAIPVIAKAHNELLRQMEAKYNSVRNGYWIAEATKLNEHYHALIKQFENEVINTYVSGVSDYSTTKKIAERYALLLKSNK